MKPLHVKAILLVAAAVWLGLLFLSGTAVSPALVKPFSMVASAVIAMIAAFDLYLWPLPILRGWFVQRPDLRGTWAVTIKSLWIDPDTGSNPPAITGYLVVRQTFSTLSLRLLTSESASSVLDAAVVRAADGPYEVTGIYRNEPRQALRGKSPIHYGAFVLRVTGNPATSLEGEYWTDRGTMGEIVTGGWRKQLVDTFAAA